MSYDVRVEQVAPRLLAVIRRRASQRELSTLVPALCGEVWKFVTAHQIDRPGRHVAIYLDGAINLEVGVEVGGAFPSADSVVPSATPAGTVATVTHFGDYAKLCDAHAAVREFCRRRGLTLAGPNWEIYGHMNDPRKVTTEVCYLVEP